MRNLIIERTQKKWLKKLRFSKFNIAVLLIALSFIAVIAKLWWLQIYNAEYYTKEVVFSNYTTHVSRGIITDFRGEALAFDVPEYEIWVDPKLLGDDEEKTLAPAAAKLLDLPENVVLDALLNPTQRSRCIKKGVDEATVKELRKLMPPFFYENGKKRSRSYYPIRGDRVFLRKYPKGAFASQVIGFINKEGVPAMGIEKALDRQLRGNDGYIETIKDKKGIELVHKRMLEIPPQNGCNVELTLDSRLQAFAEQECARIGEEFKPTSSCIIVSEAKTGRLLALANWPTFDLNKFNVATEFEKKNRVITDTYEPGSTFKVTTIAAALDAGIITPCTQFDCGSPTAFYRGKRVGLSAESHQMGMLDVKGIVRESSNRGSAQIGMLYAEKLGEQAFYEKVLKFGYGSKTNLVGGNGEQAGIVLPPKKWDGLTITRFPMGHAVSVTPLQTHNAISVIANNGVFIEPQIVSRIRTADGIVIADYQPQTRGRVISEETAKKMQIMMRGVCNPNGMRATAKIANIPGYNVAGKTGTTQKIINGRYSSQHHTASFCGFFPAENPRIIITVIIDDPTVGSGYGGSTAGPSFKRMAEEVIKQFEIPPSPVDCAEWIDGLR